MKKSRKLILIITAVIALIASMLIIASCDDSDGDPGETPKIYTLTFVTDGGTAITPIKAEAGKTITPPADPEKDGYEFVGWYLDASNTGGEPVAIPTVMPDHDVTYYAKFVEVWDGQRIKYEYNLGNVAHSGTVADTLGYAGDTKQVADGAAFGVNGYKFLGWTTTKTAVLVFSGETSPSGQYFAGDDIVFGNTDITLYAHWARVYTDARNKSSDKVCVYAPLIGGGLGAGILVRDGKADKLGFVSVNESTGYYEFEFYFDEVDGGDVKGRLYDNYTYAYASGDDTTYWLYYDYVNQSVGEYLLAMDEYDYAIVTSFVGDQYKVVMSGPFVYDEEYGDYAYAFVDEYGEEGATYFMLEECEIDDTMCSGYFRLLGTESSSYLWYDNGELYSYRLDLNGYGSANLYAYDSIEDETSLIASGKYYGTEAHEDEYGEWRFTATDGSGEDFKFMLNYMYYDGEVVLVYIEYNAELDVTLQSATAGDDSTLYINGYGVAAYTAAGMQYAGNCVYNEDNGILTLYPSELNGSAFESARPMYFEIDLDNLAFTVNDTGFIIDDGVLTSYFGYSQVVVIPDTVTEIGADAFNYQHTEVGLVSVTIPSSVTAIGARAFENNHTLRRAIFLSETPIALDLSDAATDPFRWPAGDFIIVVPEGSQEAYKAAWGDKYEIMGSLEVTILPEFQIKDGVLVRYNKPEDSGDVLNIQIPDEVVEIADGVFIGADYIASVDLNNVKTIGEQAFYGCENLEEVLFTNVETVGAGAFAACAKLSRSSAAGVVELPKIKTLGDSAFSGCESLIRVKLGEDLTAIGDMAFYECNVYEDDPTLFIELACDTAPTMGEKITVGNIAVRIQVKDIDVALSCFNAGTWSMYCRHLYIESGDEAGKYMCGADLLELDGRAVFQSSYLMMYEILNDSEIVFYEYEAPTAYNMISGTIENGVIKVAFAGIRYEFEKVNGIKTYTTEDGKYTLVVDPLDLLPENYEGYVGYASATFNGTEVSVYISGYNIKRISNFVDSDGKAYDINLSFDGNTLVVRKSAAEIYVRDITAADGSVINLHYKGSLVYVYGEIKIEVANGVYLVFSDGGTIAQNFVDNTFSFRFNYAGTIYTINVTLSNDMTTFTYTYTT